jgi:hypothetical protein
MPIAGGRIRMETRDEVQAQLHGAVRQIHDLPLQMGALTRVYAPATRAAGSAYATSNACERGTEPRRVSCGPRIGQRLTGADTLYRYPMWRTMTMSIHQRFSIAALAVATMAGAAPLTAQVAPPEPIRLHADAALLYARPLGEFAEYIDRGFGITVGTAVLLRPASPLSLRVDAGVINYGHETREVCLSSTIGCRVRVDLTTTNDILYVGFGPQLAAPQGPVQPYVHAFAGPTLFGTNSSLRGRDHHHNFAQTLNQHDVAFSWGGGGGLRLELPFGPTPVQLNLGARYHNHGRVEYLREGDITDLPDGSIALHPQRSRADLLSVHAGATIGIRPRRQPPE